MTVSWSEGVLESEVGGGGEAAVRCRGKYCDSEVGLTYVLSAWYEPLLMIGLMMKMKLELCIEICG